MSKEFWDNAHDYVFTTGETEFIGEIAFIMTELHEQRLASGL
tara:strand:+ start:508 stop:633 length:126 start_codon:yes stop_codon:yes gene_type:complete